MVFRSEAISGNLLENLGNNAVHRRRRIDESSARVFFEVLKMTLEEEECPYFSLSDRKNDRHTHARARTALTGMSAALPGRRVMNEETFSVVTRCLAMF